MHLITLSVFCKNNLSPTTKHCAEGFQLIGLTSVFTFYRTQIRMFHTKSFDAVPTHDASVTGKTHICISCLSFRFTRWKMNNLWHQKADPCYPIHMHPIEKKNYNPQLVSILCSWSCHELNCLICEESMPPLREVHDQNITTDCEIHPPDLIWKCKCENKSFAASLLIF